MCHVLFFAGSTITLGALPLAVVACMTSCNGSSLPNRDDAQAEKQAEGQCMLEKEKAQA